MQATTPQAAPIIPCEVQNGEAQRCTNSLQQNSRKEQHQIENVDSHVEFIQKSRKSEPRQKAMLESIDLM